MIESAHKSHTVIAALLLALLLALLCSSCFRDKSVGEVEPISKLSVEQSLEKSYEREFTEPLRLEAPPVLQSGDEKELQYSWEINYKEVSTSRVLEYPCDEYGKFPLRLKVTNGDDILYLTSELNVLYPYLSGVYVGASYQGRSIVSYLPFSERRAEMLDILPAEMDDEGYGNAITALSVVNYRDSYVMAIATQHPYRLLRFEANTMTLINAVATPRPGVAIDYITDLGAGTDLKVMEGNHYATIGSRDLFYSNVTYRTLRDQLGMLSFAPTLLKLYNPANRMYVNSVVYFDNAVGRFIIAPDNGGKTETFAAFADQFAGLQLVGMDTALDRSAFVAILSDHSGGHVVAMMKPGIYSTNSVLPITEQPAVLDRRAMPTSLGVSDATQMAVSNTSNLLYFSVGNRIYAYQVQSQGNFPTEPLFVCGQEEVVVDMVIDSKSERLYVATNHAAHDRQGSIYCYDIQRDNALLWQKKQVTGEIKQIFVRER